MPVMALGLAALSIFVLVNSHVRARGFERGQLTMSRIQPWTSSGRP